MNPLIEEIKIFFSYVGYAESTKKSYRRSLQCFAEFLAVRTGSDINELHLEKIVEVYFKGTHQAYLPLPSDLIDEYLYRLTENNYSYHTIKHQKKALTAFLSYLQNNYDFPNIMADLSFNIEKYKPKDTYKKILNQHEILKFFQFVSISDYLERDTLLFSLIITTGCRISEILNIKVQDINWDDDSFSVPKIKMNKSKTVPLRKGFTKSMKLFCDKHRLTGNDYLFNLSRSQFYGIYHRYLAHAKLPKLGIHTFRNSFATFLAEEGTDITVIKQLLDHEDLTTTEGYIAPNIIRNQNIKIPQNDHLFERISRMRKEWRI